MAFCNSCGANLEAGAKFCNKCGATQTGAPASTPVPAATQPAQSSSGLKIVLIVVGVLVALFIVGVAGTAFVGWRIAKSTHVRQDGNNVKVETPFGTVESTDNPSEAAKSLEVDMYPGAELVKGTTVDMTIAGTHTSAADFETSDPVAKVAEFYKSKYPGANIVSSNGDQFSLVAGDKNNLVTINVEPQEGKTRIHMARVMSKSSN